MIRLTLGAAIMIAAPGCATAKAPPIAGGLYEIDQMEMAGGLELQPNGRFRYAFDYGAVRELLPDVLVFRRLHQANMSRELLDHTPKALLRVVKLTLDRRRGRRIAD